jgi:hypothetical protein
MKPNIIADSGAPSVFRKSIINTIASTSVCTKTWTEGTN